MQHLRYHNISYYEHMKRAFRFSFLSLTASAGFFLHGIYPDALQYFGSDVISTLVLEMATLDQQRFTENTRSKHTQTATNHDIKR